MTRLLLVVILCGFSALTASSIAAQDKDYIGDWSYLQEEVALQQLHHSLSQRVLARPTVFREVRIVDPVAESTSPPVDLRVSDGQILSIGDGVNTDGARVVEGRGRYLVPGLCDMHVHGLTSTAQPLMNLLHGVTCVREMGGFSFLLRMRDEQRGGRRLDPRAYIAGPILTDHPMYWYSDVVTHPREVREAIAAQRAAGYDFVKLHNSMHPELVRVVFDAADAAGLPAVGHTPHRTPLSLMVRRARTIEHLSGILIEPNLALAKLDWLGAATSPGAAWLTPTLYSMRPFVERDVQPPDLLPASERRAWLQRSREPRVPMLVEADETKRGVVRRLAAQGARLLAGTDSGGGYPMMVYGVALHDEINSLHVLGLSPAHALAAATSSAGDAIADPRLGRLRPGAYADLVLVTENPLVSLDALRHPITVCVAGRCLLESDLVALEKELRVVFETETGAVDVERWLQATYALGEHGYVFRDNYLEVARLSLIEAGRSHNAAGLARLKTDPDFSFATGNHSRGHQ